MEGMKSYPLPVSSAARFTSTQVEKSKIQLMWGLFHDIYMNHCKDPVIKQSNAFLQGGAPNTEWSY